ncbi:hypothetical protein BO94DRAFT_574647 [Aspergillus sclerotioniger CBS 115572]|uniref:Transcription factor domain-containing protein n=1 Tax=Aspergillus sclerotioniger CBS 115572 TaxID=1450535 RepID=A0A317WTT6_9EURO|nr:hypothetical protein BO94DRAFT_574647 [Aspergillus sclerotioniger CBS 115572]PWY88597.1 hypothetical protein BO94DRAFT_574647 [Aspergillus sclerotioniger CBS 115572]
MTWYGGHCYTIAGIHPKTVQIGRVSESDRDAPPIGSTQGSRHDKPHSSLEPIEHAAALHGLYEALPSESEMDDIFQNRSKWWDSWRESFGLSWGDEDDSSLECFATPAFSTGHPATGNFARYLPPVEKWILNNDELAGSGYGLQYLMDLGLCFMSSLQPRRACVAYRKANTLMQLAGIHRTHRTSKSLDTLFWQVFAADRHCAASTGYLDLKEITLCQKAKEKHTRAFCLAHVHNLKAHLYMPSFLQRSRDDRQEYSRIACVRSARILLEAYIFLYESDPAMTSTDNSIKQSGLSALTAAVIVCLNLLGYGTGAVDPVSESGIDKDCDEGLINRIIVALRGRTLDKGECRDIVVPYFGMVTVDRRDHSLQGDADPWLQNPTGTTSSVLNVDTTLPALYDDIFLSYSGPWALHNQNHGEAFAGDSGTALD